MEQAFKDFLKLKLQEVEKLYGPRETWKPSIFVQKEKEIQDFINSLPGLPYPIPERLENEKH